MKKLALIVLAIALLIVPMSVCASAAPALNDYEKAIIASLDENIKVDDLIYHIPQDYVTKAENFLKTVDITKAQHDEIMKKIDAAKEIVVVDHITSDEDLKVLPQGEKEKLLKLGQEAAAAAEAVLTYDGKNVTVTHNSTTVFEDAPIVKVTGAEADFTAIALAVAGVVALLTASVVVASKKGLLSK